MNIVDFTGQVIKSGEKIVTNHSDNKTQRHVSNNDNQTKCHISDNTTSAQKFTATLGAVNSGLNSLSKIIVSYNEYCVSRDTNQVNLDTKSREIEQKREVELSRISADLEKVKVECNRDLETQSIKLDKLQEGIKSSNIIWQKLFDQLMGDRELLLSPRGAELLRMMSECQTSIRDMSIALIQVPILFVQCLGKQLLKIGPQRCIQL